VASDELSIDIESIDSALNRARGVEEDRKMMAPGGDVSMSAGSSREHNSLQKLIPGE